MGRSAFAPAVAAILMIGCTSTQISTPRANPLTQPALHPGDTFVYAWAMQAPAYSNIGRSTIHILSVANGVIGYRMDEAGRTTTPAHKARPLVQSYSGHCSLTAACGQFGMLPFDWFVYVPSLMGLVPKDLAVGSVWSRSFDTRPSAWARFKRDLYCRVYACSTLWEVDRAGVITTRVTALDAHTITLLIDEASSLYPRDESRANTHYARSYELRFRDGLLESANENPAKSKGRFGWSFKRVASEGE